MIRPFCMHGKRGDISFVLVVIVTIAAVLSATMVMVMVNKDFGIEGSSISLLSENADSVEEYVTMVSFMVGSKEIFNNREESTLAQRFVTGLGEQKSLLAQSRGFYERVTVPEAVRFVATDEGYSLYISAIPIIIIEGKHRMQRIMNLQITFDEQGRVHKVYKEYSA